MRPLALLALLAVLAGGCGDAATEWVTLDASDAGRTISLGRADHLEVRLPGNLTTGYSWEALGFDDGVLRLVDGPGYESDRDLAGSDGTFTFEFQCAGPGTTVLELGYLRPWEDEPPLRTWSVTIVAS